MSDLAITLAGFCAIAAIAVLAAASHDPTSPHRRTLQACALLLLVIAAVAAVIFGPA